MHDKRANILSLLSRNLQTIRKSRGLTQSDVARLGKLHPTYYSAIERGEINVSLGTLEKITTALQVTFPELLNSGNGDKHSEMENRLIIRILHRLRQDKEKQPEMIRKIILFLDEYL